MTPRKKVLLIGATTGYQTRVLADAAERLGLGVILATDRCHVLDDPWGDHAVALRFDDPAGAADALAGLLGVDGIVAVGDLPAYIAALAAERLRIPFSPAEAVARCRDKFLARESFRKAGLAVPEFYRVEISQGAESAADQARYPCILKPLGLSASRGVIRANDRAEFVAAFRRIARLLEDSEITRLAQGQNRFIQVEDFIEGREYALEGILTHGALRVLAIFDKPDPLDGPYFEETIYVTPSREPAARQQAMIETTERAVSALGLTHGPIHAEMRVNERGVWMLEVAARPIGGLCARVLPGLEELILGHAAGQDVSGIAMRQEAAGVMMIPIPREGIFVEAKGLADALAVPDIEDVIITAKQGQRMVPLPEGASYLGFIFARGRTPNEAENALRCAHARLTFEIASALPVV